MNDELLNNITNVIAYGFYPCTVILPKIENYNFIDKLINYFLKPQKYENELFRFEICSNKIKYKIINNYEPESNLYNEFMDCYEYYEFDIIDNKFFTNGQINYRHLLMLNDFENFGLEFDYITNDEFQKYYNSIKNIISKFSEKELIDIIKNTFNKTKSYNYNYNIHIYKAPLYDINLKNLDGFIQNRNQNIDEEITNRIWYTYDAYMSSPAKIFCIKSQYYTCLNDQKLYFRDVSRLMNWGIEYKLKPYDTLYKYEGGIQFNHCHHTYWNKLISNLSQIGYYRPYFELIGHNNYKGSNIPIHELIIFCKILDNEGANCSYIFS